MADLLFYVLAALAVAAALGVVMSRNPLFSVLSLLGSFFCLASIYLLAGFQFLAATQLLVYAGAIMVLFLFVIMLLNLGDETQYVERPESLGKRRVAIAGGTAVALLLVAVFSVGLRPTQAAETASAADPGATSFAPTPVFQDEAIDDLVKVGELLFSRYVLAFEAASLLLLATMIAVILLAKRQRGDVREAAGWPWQKGVEQ
ncbi:MAG: NADH-quinone oxidoreductase subunit J [Planctomycetota bacterium]